MSEIPSRVHRAFGDHGSFEQLDETTYEHVSTPFAGVVDVAEREDAQIQFDVTVTVPPLDAVTEETVAEVVEDGWYETFELRITDISGVTRGDHDFEPVVAWADGEIVVEVSLSDINVARGVEDAAAVVTFVEGTYVQGIIPGYEYTDPVSSILSKARQQGNSGAF